PRLTIWYGRCRCDFWYERCRCDWSRSSMMAGQARRVGRGGAGGAGQGRRGGRGGAGGAGGGRGAGAGGAGARGGGGGGRAALVPAAGTAGARVVTADPGEVVAHARARGGLHVRPAVDGRSLVLQLLRPARAEAGRDRPLLSAGSPLTGGRVLAAGRGAGSP